MISRWSLALRCVLRAPDVIERQLPQLLVVGDIRGRAAGAQEAERTVRLAHRMLGGLGRLRRINVNHWRVTCLYRSVSECLVLRELGFPARVLIGARADAATNSIAAHAWVECEGVRCASTRGEEQYEVLSASSALTAVQ